MTLPKINDLSNEQIRVMCAEACGWTCDRSGGWSKWSHPTLPYQNTRNGLPDYCGSVDAALTLCAWMAEHKGLCWDSYTQGNGKVYFRFKMNYPEGHEKYSSADTFALAVSRAFLLANHLAE